MWKMLKHIAQTHRKRLIGTFSLVGLENLLMLVYPVFGGRAINAVIAGEVWQALLYALVVLLMWLVGAARRIADTRLRVLISNREAFGYLCVGTAMGILFGFAFVMMTLKGYSSAGHVYSVGTYLWMFAMSLDDVPRLVEQYSNLKDIGQRIEWSERNIKAGT